MLCKENSTRNMNNLYINEVADKGSAIWLISRHDSVELFLFPSLNFFSFTSSDFQDRIEVIIISSSVWSVLIIPAFLSRQAYLPGSHYVLKG